MNRTAGYGSGILGIAIFSGTLPATRLGELGFDPVFLTGARGAIAALIGGAMLLWLRAALPRRADLPPLLLVALGVVLGFPLLTGLALRSIGTAHSIVWTALLPLSTALFGVLRGGERPSVGFWLFSLTGAAAVMAFALGEDQGGSWRGDGLMLAAILAAGLGYAEGAVLSRRLGGWQVISWALCLAAPAMTMLAFAFRPVSWAVVPMPAWVGLGYVSAFSMMLGFVFWYRGLAIGGTARVGQLQLLQPLGGMALCGMVLGEPVPAGMVAVAGAVLVCVAGAKRFA